MCPAPALDDQRGLMALLDNFELSQRLRSNSRTTLKGWFFILGLQPISRALTVCFDPGKFLP
jgi:hypothetical protein